jgi:hypothetical protein
MVQAVQVRERELAMALNESRELTSVTAESRRRVEAAHADLLAYPRNRARSADDLQS